MTRVLLAIGLVFALLLSACGHSDDKNTAPPGTSPSAAPALQGSEEAGEADGVTITKEEYGKISSGMSYKEVADIVGGEGDVVTESGDKGSDMYAMGVMYKGEGDLGASATFIFLGDKLQTKTQFGLK